MIIVVTDLDGCLLDPKTYDYREAVEPLKRMLEMGVEVVFNSSKTRVEQEYYRVKWGIRNVFASENGAAVFIPIDGSYKTIVNGVERNIIEERLGDIISDTRSKLLWLDDITPEIFAARMNMPFEVAGLALIREYSTLFLPNDVDRDFISRAIDRIAERGFRVQTGSGRVYVVTGDHDKGDSFRIIRGYFDRISPGNIYIGVGDGFNDLPMLMEADYSVILGNRGLAKEVCSKRKRCVYIERRGPGAWLEGISRILEEYGLPGEK